MPRGKKKIVSETPITETLQEPVVKVETTTEVAVESEAKKAFRSYIENYKVKNPVKYKIKEADLLKQLNQL